VVDVADLSDDELIHRCRLGDASAWELLVGRYSALVYSIPRRYGLPTGDCDDVHQAVFAALVTGIGSIQRTTALPKWLMTSAHRECWRISRARSRTVNTDTDFVSVSDPHDSTVAEVEQAELVRLGLAELGGKCQQLLQMCFGELAEPDYQTISRLLGVPMGSIGPSKQRCMAKLAEILKRLGIRA